MSLWRQLTRGIRSLTHPASAQQDVDDEVQHYFDEAIAASIARGLSPAEARRQARLDFGTMSGVSEDVRSYGWERFVGAVVADLRYGARRLRATPGFTAVTILTLAIGIGATTAIFGAVNPILFEPLPYPQAGRIVSVLEMHPETVGTPAAGTFAMYRRLVDRSRTLEWAAVTRTWQPTVTGTQQPERLIGQRVSVAYFRVLGVAPNIGRDFEAADDRVRGPRVTILSDATWRRHFAADPAIVGRDIRLDDNLYTVIGVMPPSFDNVLGPEAGIWTTLQYDSTLPNPHGVEWGHHLQTIARLRPGVRVEEVSREINAIGHGMIAELHPETYSPNTVFAAALLKDNLTRGVKPALLVILAAAMLVMLIACVNVTNLLLARGVQRRGEFALRAALGAGRGRLTRQLLTESLLLAALGGVFGLAVAALGIRALLTLVPPGLPRAGAISVSVPMFAFGLLVTTVIGVTVGLVPALQAARNDSHGLEHGSRQIVSHARARRALVVAEIALALVLLVSSGLLLRSMERLFGVPIGFDSADLLTMQVHVVGHRFDEAAVQNRFFEQALEAVGRVPGVIAAGFTEQLPMSGDRDEYGARFAQTPTLPAAVYSVYRYPVSPGYVEAMRIPLRRGRLLDARDSAGAPLAALISESLANDRFRERDPIGEQLRIGPAGPFTIVGVVGNVKQVSLALADSDAVYLNATQSWFTSGMMSLVVRASGNAAALAPAVRQTMASIDKDQTVVRVATMDALLAASAAERRFALILFEAFAIAALVLAAAGIYGVLAGSVVERTREIGVRTALGATRLDIVRLVVRQGMLLTALGGAIGLLGATTATRAIVAMLFSISRLDPITYAGVIAILAAVSAMACAVPAWRAAHVDPAVTLRAE
jgi:putative ABC transport system permease protein